MARPKEFDRDEALRTAMHVFRKQGFSGTTTDDLRLAIGIGRQSFYDTFKGKKEIYDEVLRIYANDRFSTYIAKFRSSDSPLKAIENILMTIPKEGTKERKLACLGVASICEFGDSDKEIAAVNEDAGATILAMLEKLVSEGQAKGEIRSSLRPKSAALFLLTLLGGLRVSAQSGSAPEAMVGTIKVAIDGLRER